MKKFAYILFSVIVFSSCSEFQKAIKSEDVATKFKMGTELFDAGKYGKANRLFVQIVPKYRGKPQAQKLMYMYSMSFYHMKDYYTANYQFERFVSAYPTSEKLEEAAFLGAKSYYHLSPVYTKDQKDTKEAIEKLQEFINRFQESEYLDEANVLVKELDYKLENKAFSIAKQYNHINDFQSSIRSFDNFILEYPGTPFREKAMFYRLDSAYKLAINSISNKKEARIESAIAYYNTFKKSYTDSEFVDQANEMIEELNGLLQEFNTKS
jgi:outer membrane protein assembly factor BamD